MKKYSWEFDWKNKKVQNSPQLEASATLQIQLLMRTTGTATLRALTTSQQSARGVVSFIRKAWSSLHLPLRRDWVLRTLSEVMQLNPTVMLVLLDFLDVQTIRRLLIRISPCSPLLPFVSSTGSWIQKAWEHRILVDPSGRR